jgi:hypothetical protein
VRAYHSGRARPPPWGGRSPPYPPAGDGSAPCALWFLTRRGYLHPGPTALDCYLTRREDKSDAETTYYKENYASTVVDAQRNPANPRQHRSFLSVLCVCLAAIRSAFLGTSRDGALHSEARQFLTQLRTTMHSTSDVEYLLEANAYWLCYSKLDGSLDGIEHVIFGNCKRAQKRAHARYR